MKNIKFKYALGVVAAMLFGTPALLAQETAASQPAFWDDTFGVMVIIGAAVVVVAAFVTVLRMFYALMRMQQMQYMKDAGMDMKDIQKKMKAESASNQMLKSLTGAVPLAKEKDILLDHDYDGIEELDNPLPPWWVALFWITIIFAVVYWGYYHTFEKGPGQEEMYATEMERAEAAVANYLNEQGEVVDENTVVFLSDESSLARGKEIFDSKCVACHEADGGGNNIGPNLTDDYWIHGGSMKDIFTTVKYGVVEKGMLAWETQLGPSDMAKVSSYIKSLVGTTPANPKDPQGELWVEAEAPAEGAAAPAEGDAATEEGAETEEGQE
ncbi:MAG: cytochrome C oxidase subunit III [Bacteroidetes bacterium]|nr:MAG: cytochrome C oxidase subunit III [Bacteroidota bacterium]